MVALRVGMALAVAGGVAAAAWADDEHEVEYSSLSEAQQAVVKGYQQLPEGVPKPSSIIRLPSGEPDERTPEQRYLHPNHPGVQPRPADSTYLRYIDVPNDAQLPRHRRPELEQSGHRFATLPDISVPGTIPQTYYISPEGIYPKLDPFSHPPGTNLLPTVYQDARDGLDHVMPNTLPSSRTEPYHLHDGPPRVTPIDPSSPTNDLRLILDRVYQMLTGHPVRGLWEDLDRETYEQVFLQVGKYERRIRENAESLKYHLRWAIDIIEGNPVPGRYYSGFPLFHHSGFKRIKRVIPILGKDGRVVGGNVEIHQVWYDQRIENDTMYLDFYGDYDPPGSDLPAMPDDIPWTITYTIDVLDRGADDFSPTTMYFDDPEATARYAAHQGGTPEDRDQLKQQMRAQYRLRSAPDQAPEKAPMTLPHVAMDQTFFPMDEGTRTVLKVKMPPHKYFNLIYTWGWRVHPPRAQAVENAHKVLPPNNIPIVEPERKAFQEGVKNPLDAIGDLAPAKRMWRAFKGALEVVERQDPKYTECLEQVLDARSAFLDWKDRTHLPSGLRPDPDSDLTLLYVNNTIYGELSGGGYIDLPKWRERGTPVRITLINGDYFDHGYQNIDFGSNRGWENQFKPTIQVAGSGSFFTFGRFHWRMNTNPGTITVQRAVGLKHGKPSRPGELPDAVIPGVHRVWIDLHHDPSRRLRFYQFDPAHHDVAIYSIH
jgi:hypothetical protein